MIDRSKSKSRATVEAIDANDRSVADTTKIAGLSDAEFADRFFRPRHSQSYEVEAAIGALSDPSEAWEILAARGLISVDWTSAGARQITVDGTPCRACGDKVEFVGHIRGCEHADVPATVAAAAALASDPERVLAAEGLARAAFDRLEAGTGEDEPRVIWRVVDPRTQQPLSTLRPGRAKAKTSKSQTSYRFNELRDALNWRPIRHRKPGYKQTPDGRWAPVLNSAARRMHTDPTSAAVVYAPWFAPFFTDLSHAWGWATATRERRANPFESMVQIWALGYAVDVIDDDYIVLVAPFIAAIE